MTSNDGDIDNWDVSDSFGNDWRYSRIWLQATLASAPITLTAAYFIVFRLHRNWATSCCLGVNSSLVICCCQVLPADYYQVLLSITCHLLLSSITEYHRVLPSISKYYRVLPSITEYYQRRMLWKLTSCNLVICSYYQLMLSPAVRRKVVSEIRREHMGLHQISGPLMFTGNNTDGVMKHPTLA